MFDIKCIKNIEGLKAISKQWDQLLLHSINNSYSLSRSWIFNWIEIFMERNQPLCIVIFDKDMLVGLAPFWVENTRVFGKQIKILRFLGSSEVCGDHLDLIVHHKDPEKICKAIWEHLFGPLKKEWDVWEYNNVDADSNLLKHLYTCADQDRRCLGLRINGFMANPYINLPEKWDAYLSTLNSKKRRALKVSTNLLSEAGTVELKFCETVQDLPLYMNTHITLHRKSWDERGKTGSFGTEKFKQFHYNYAEEQLKYGHLFLCNLELNSVPVGSLYGFVYDKILHYYLIGTNRTAVPRASVGKVLIAKCIEEAIKRGYKKFDFLRGIESYKYDWTDSEKRELIVTFYNRSVNALLYILKQFISSYGRQVCNVVFKEKMNIVKMVFGKAVNTYDN